MKLPIYSDSARTGDDGLAFIKTIVERDFKWLFRKNHQENDFGIDAYIDVIAEKGQVTGKTIALQIKTGASYFKEEGISGWVYRDRLEHLNYYLNHDIPVGIILVDLGKNAAFWNICEPQKTERTGDNWKIEIPFSKIFDKSCKNELLKYISPVRDYVSQLEEFWELNTLMRSAGRILFIVDKDDILNREYDALVTGIERLKVNSELIHLLKNRVDISIDGYNEHEKELYEIEEVQKWINAILSRVNGLSYFLAKDQAAQFLRLLQACKVKFLIEENNVIKPDGRRGRNVIIDMSTAQPFFDELFADLNEFTDTHNIPLEVNKEISFKIMEYLLNDKLPDHIKK